VVTRPFLHSLLACSLLVSPALAQSTCAPEKLRSAIDTYANEPFSARAWRKMTGLGDPGVEAASFDSASYATGEEWRKLATEVLPGSEALANPNYNCRLSYPLEILKQRIATFGKTSDYVRQWASGQESVIRSCGSGAVVPVPVSAPPANLKPADLDLLKFDRAYQDASVLFYAKPADAAVAFKAIATSNSPHKAAARYNVANILANAKNVVSARAEAQAILNDPSLSSVHDITRDLLGYMANLEDTASAWSELIDRNVTVLGRSAKAIVGNAKAEGEMARALYDMEYGGVTAKRDDWWITNTLPENATLSKALADAARKHPMVMWMMAGQSVYKPTTQAPWAMMGPTWVSWTTSYVDRAMALQTTGLPVIPKVALESLKSGSDDAARANLWNDATSAADKAQASCGEASETAAVALLALQATRVSAQANRYDEIYIKLRQLKLEGTSTLRLKVLPKLMQHILATGNVEEGRRLRDAFITDQLLAEFKEPDLWQRAPYADYLAWVAEDEAAFMKAVKLMDQKLSPRIFNLLPASKLRALADDGVFSPAQKALLKRAAWTRNYARGIANSEKTTADMLAANPEIAAAFEAASKEFPKAKADRLWALTILRNPRFGILVNSPDSQDVIEAPRPVFATLDEFDPNDKNWWCPLETDRQLAALRRDYDATVELTYVRTYPSKELLALLEKDGLSKVDAARDKALRQHPLVSQVNWKEVASLAEVPSAPKLLAQAATRWGKISKGDDGAPEALALAVRATRYGCRWHGSHEAYSKPAQELLKAKFATTSWAAQTPYWFGCMDASYDAQGKKLTTCKPRDWPKQPVLK
jgi:hypothetical protein